MTSSNNKQCLEPIRPTDQLLKPHVLKNVTSFLSPKADRGGADLSFLSPQPDTSLHCETMASALCIAPVYIQAFTGTHCTYVERDGHCQAELI